MIEIRIPKEIRTYKEKLFFGLNLRQLVCTLIAIVVNVPLYWFGRDIVGPDTASWIVIFIAMPLFMIGYFSYNGMTFEQFIKSVIQQEIIYPQKRKYVTVNLFEVLSNTKEKEKGESGRAVQKKKRSKKEG
ncbi:PrgI family protein [Paenibacillus tuaregi]|uniref:PrgI family protein n=1 Tax=Paenibacillus tuaregi TaxID=1816681 RepID=UPI0008382552|nr:PrgI family protein [Paenibacillus tuaregi]